MRLGPVSLPGKTFVVLLFLFCLLPGQGLAAKLNRSPDCTSAVASPSSLWPVNHTFIDIGISGVSDPEGDPLEIAVQCILQDEEINKTGDGNFIYDGAGINTPVASVRSERSGNNNGRVYHIDFIATDSEGARCGGEVLVSVPHSPQRPAVDEGRLFHSVPSDNECGRHDINNAPWIYSEPVLTGASHEAYRYDVNGHDPDRDVLAYSLTQAPDGMTIDPATGLVTWVEPVPGEYNVIVAVTDNRGGTDQQTYLLFINGPPHITSEPVLLHQAGSAYTYQVTATDPNNDILEYSLTQAPEGMTIDSATGLVTWTEPVPSEHDVAIKVADNRGGTDQQTYSLFINGPPQITSEPVLLHQAGSGYAYQVTATDPNNDVLEYSLTLAPEGTTIDSATGLVTWTEPVPGEHDVAIKVADNRGGTDQQTYSLFINGLPEITSEPVLLHQTGSAYAYQVTATDPNKDVLEYSLTQAPEGMNIDPATGLATWTEPVPGEYDVTIEVTDNRGGSDQQTCLLFINGPPQITSEPVLLHQAGNAYAYQVTADDPNDDVLAYSLTQAPEGMTIDPATGLVTWLEPEDGAYPITILVADGHGGTDEQPFSLTIVSPPTVDLTAGAPEITAGESTTLTWTSTHAETLVIAPGIGAVEQSGIKSVSPAETTTYTITATGPGGTATDSVIITVSAPSIDLVPDTSGIDDDACPASVNLLVGLKNSGKGIAEPGVSVTFYNGNPENGGQAIGTAKSLGVLDPDATETVALQWNSPPAGEATIYARVDDTGDGTGEFDEINEDNNLVSYDVSLCEELQAPSANSISGEVIDAVTGERLSNTVVDLHVSTNGEPGEVVASFRTNYEGIFIFRNLAPGAYIITGAVAGFAKGERYASLAKNAVLQHQDLVLSPVLEDDDIRIILTWGEKPQDLEAHLTVPNPDGCRHHVFYWDQEVPGANLDLDDRQSYGPETITITEPVSGTYRYYVHNFSDRSSLSNYYLSYYGAEVKVYLAGAEEPLVFKTPSNRYTKGTVWHVFDLDGETGEITPVNKFTHQVEPGPIDFPRITSSPGQSNKKITAYWGTPYTYQITAEDPDDDKLTYSLIEGPEGMTVDPDTGLVEWTPLGIPESKYLITVKVSDERCGETTQSYDLYTYSTPYVIFNADPCSAYNENGDITLSWTVQYAKTIIIDNGIGVVEESQGNITIPSPAQPTIYKLTAFNDVTSVTLQTPRTAPAPRITVPTGIRLPGQATWISYNCGCSATCEITPGIGKVSGSGYVEVSPLETTYYIIRATNAVGTAADSGKLTVSLPSPPAPPTPPIASPPDIRSFSGDPNCDWSTGEPITLSWETRYATSCEITPGVGQVPCNGSIEVTPNVSGEYMLIARGDGGVDDKIFEYPLMPTSYKKFEGPSPTYSSFFSYAISYVNPGDEILLRWWPSCADTVTITDLGEVETPGNRRIIVPDTLPKTYTLTATNERGSATTYVELRQAPLSGTFTTADGFIKPGESAVLNWTSNNASKCTITPNVGEVVCGSGSVTVIPSEPTTYTLTLESGAGTKTYTLHVTYVSPNVNIQAMPETINQGEASTLSWLFSNAISCSIDQGIGEVAQGQTLKVSPAETTTYTITAVGPGETKTDSVTVTVIPANPEPTATLTINPAVIWKGGESVLAWSTEYADSVTISPDIGAVAASGSQTISPAATTSYTITATGAGGAASALSRITVMTPPPTVTLTATPENIEIGGSSILSWTSEHADSVTISPSIGKVGASGSLAVSPAATTTYTITATGPGGSDVASVTVSYPAPAATFSADPATITYPGSATLSWNATNATSVTITPNIGAVDPSGSLELSPTSNTTYTITATGPGGSVTKSLTVAVVYPLPAISLSAEPASVAKGGSALLTWSTDLATTCTLLPDVIPVLCNGSHTVTPGATTVYTLVANGLGGSSQSTATVTVMQPPAISFVAAPSTINAGESATLTWEITGADSVRIDQGIGEVESSGSLAVFPSQTTTYTVSADGAGGTSAQQVTVTVISPISITITSHSDGVTLSRRDVLVTGTVSHANNLETGVVVNGVVALVHNGQFAANDVPLQEGEDSIVVYATDVNGATAEQSISVTVQPVPKRVDIRAAPETGLAPLETDIIFDSNFVVEDPVAFSIVGPGAMEFLPSADSETFPVNVAASGLYYVTATAQDEYGVGYSDTVAILAVDRSVFDAMLQAKWSGMKDAMIAGDIEGSVSYFAYAQQETFRQVYTLVADKLAQKATDMQTIELIDVTNDRAEYRLKKDIIFNGEPVTVTFFVYFQREPDGIWRIWDY